MTYSASFRHAGPRNGSPPKPSPRRGILSRVKEYQKAFDRLSLSHRNAPSNELAELLAREAARFQLVMSEVELGQQAVAIRQRGMGEVRVRLEHLLE